MKQKIVKNSLFKRILIVSLLILYSLTWGLKPVLAAETGNKFGLNLAARSDQVDYELVRYLDQDGWVVMMPNAPNYQESTAQGVYNEIVGNYFSKLGSQVNYILRAHHPFASNPIFTDNPTFPDSDDPGWADKWADFWAGIINNLPIPENSSFYVIPWNEPNLQRECSGIGDTYNPNDCDCVPYVLSYTDKLLSRLDRSKVKVLTPSFAVSAPNFYGFAACLGGGSYFDRFDGISMQYYDFETGCNEPFCNPNPMLNPDLYPQLLSSIGASGKPLFITETGLVSPEGCAEGVPDCPNFTQPDITLMLCELYNRHKNDPNLVMFSPLTYNPEKDEGNWFWDTPQTKQFYLERYSDCSQAKEIKPIPLTGQPSGIRSVWEKRLEDEDITTFSPPPATPASSPVLAARTKPAGNSGRVVFHEVNFPDFSPIANKFAGALTRLLPEIKSKNVSLPGKTSLKFSSFVVPGRKEGDQWVWDEDNATSCEDAAKETADVPADRWGRLAGATKGLLHLQPEQLTTANHRYLENFAYKFVGVGEHTCLSWSFGPGMTVKEAKLPEPANDKEEFRVVNLLAYLVRETVDYVNNVITSVFEKTVQVRPNAELEYGSIVPRDTTQVAGVFLPEQQVEDWDPKDEAEGLTVAAEDQGIVASVHLSPGDSGGHELMVAKQGRTRNYDCALLCSLHPEKEINGGMDWVGEAICPSCNSNDYQPPAEPKPAPEDLPQYCIWDEWVGGCDYYDPNYCQNHQPDNPDCDECQLCEGCRCLPGSLPPPGKFFCADGPNCDTSCVGQCHWEYYELNPAGGYGPCYYKNPNVCRHGPGCASICNAACCPG